VRKTKTIATLGPESWGREVLRGMIAAGADILRINLSYVSLGHGYDFLAEVVAEARKIAHDLGRVVEIMIDLPGHKFRLGEFIDRKVKLGDSIELTSKVILQDGQVPFPYEDYLSLMRVGQEIIFGDGIPRLEVVEEGSKVVQCKVTLAGLLKSHYGLTARGLKVADLGLPSLTKADHLGLKFAIRVKAEQVVMSYGTSAKQMDTFIKCYRGLGGFGKVLFKYELAEAGNDLEAIVSVSDGGFVGQGDLGLSVPSEFVPGEAAKVVDAFRVAGKPCIVGTQLLTSMKKHPFPTHGERAGVHYNVLIGATGLMVSDETSMGEFPVEVVQILVRLINAAEGITSKTARVLYK